MRGLRLSRGEQENVRRAMRMLRHRLGSRAYVAAALRVTSRTVHGVLRGGPVSFQVAARVAALLGTEIDALVDGTYHPPGICPFCGRR